MSKVKKYSRQLMVLFLVMATVLTCIFVFTPETQASESGNYTVRLKLYVSTFSDCLNSVTADMTYKSNNGKGSDSNLNFSHSELYSLVNSETVQGTYQYTVSKRVAGFPTALKITSNLQTASGTKPPQRNFGVTATIQVLDASGNWKDLGSGVAHANSAQGSDSTLSHSYTVGSGDYPAITTHKFYVDGANTSSVTVKTGETHLYSASAYDQYGVRWVGGIASANWNKTCTSEGVDEKSINVSFTDTNGGTDYSSTLSVVWNNASSYTATLTANVLVPHTLTIDTNGGTYSGTNPVTGKYTGETATVSTPTRGGYTFTSWSKTAGNGSLSGNVFTFGSNNATVKAGWTPENYTISPVNGSETLSSVGYNIETTNITLPTLSKTGYTFSGWVVSKADGNWTVGESVTSDPSGKYGNITVEPLWTPNSYTLNFNANKTGATVSPASMAVKFETAIGTLPVPSATAYDFAGWYTDATAGTKVTADTIYSTVGNMTVFAHWTPTVYNITFNTDGGNNIDAKSYDVEDTSVVLPVPVKTGYTFSHWVVEKQAGNWTTGVTVNGSLNANYGNVGLKAVYTPNNYVLDFDVNKAGATVSPESKTVVFNSAIGELPVPSVDGYDFVAWYTEADGGSVVTASTVYTTAANSTIYATWTPVTYNIITDANGGNDIADSTYTIENGTIPAGGTRTGYTFSHWEVAADAGNWVKGETFNTGDSVAGKFGEVTLKAVWTANKYTANFVGNAPASSVSQPVLDKTSITVTYDSAVNVNEALPVATRNGYTFLGWFTQPEGGDKLTTSTVYKTTDTTTYYAQWSLVEYTLSFNVNNGNALAPVTYTIEDELVLPVASRDGYKFTGWFYNNVNTGSWIRNTSYAPDALNLGTGNWGDVEIKANYTVIAYDITWIINGKTEVTTHPYNTYPAHEDPVVEDDPRYSYTFTGWDPVITIVTGEATYTAMFDTTPKQYTVSWVANGEVVHSQKVNYGEAVPTGVATVPSKTGHTGEWDYTGITTMPAEDITIEAVYTPINYTIKWEADGVVIDTDTVPYGTLPQYTGATPVKAENAMYTYNFKGWTPSVVAVTGDATYVAEFTSIPKEYTITWIADGQTVATHTIAYGSRITNIPDVPAKLGMVGSWAGVPDSMPAEDITINAVYVDGCLVTWYIDGTKTGAYYQLGFENGQQIVYDRPDPVHPEDAEYNYTFLGWSETPDGGLITGYPVAGSEDYEYYAVYAKSPKVYTIKWIADGNVVLEETIAFGSGITNIPAVPDKTGHSGVWKSVPSTMPAKDVTVNAQYTPNDYTITWVVGENVYPTIFAYGTTPEFTGITHKPSTETTDYTFIGWDNTITAVEGDTTYTAQYKESARKYTVTWQYEDGTVIDTYSVANGAAITEIPVIADKTGHTYSYVVPEVMPTHDVVIKVVYEAISYTITWVTPSGEIKENWKYGTTPVYTGAVPEKEATPEKEFTFSGWSPSVLVVTGDATYTAQFTSTARKYSVVWFVNGEFYDARDIAFGDVIPNLDVPQVVGYNGVWDNPYRTMPARDLTINAVYNAKKYTVYWKVDGLTVYSASVAYGDAIPSKQVPEKLGCTGEWVNVPDKMPAENITISAIYKANEYSITWRINGMEYSDKVVYGNEYVLELGGETIPDEIRVTIGGSVMNTESYHYDIGTGTLTIYGNAIVGNIFITARVSGGSYNVILNITNATTTNKNLVVAENTVYHTQIIPNAGYLLPASVEVFVDGMPVDGFTYDPVSGKLTINAEAILGEVEIAFDCPPDPDYDPNENPDGGNQDSSNCSCGCHSKNAFTKFFFDLATFFRKLFGMDEYRYCECGAAHW